MSDFPIVVVKNLPYHTSNDQLFELFSKYGNIHQVRVPDRAAESPVPMGSCFVVYKNTSSAQQAAKRINGINFEGRYLVASMYSVDMGKLKAEDFASRREQLSKLKDDNGIA